MLSTLLYASSASAAAWQIANVGSDGIYRAEKSAVSVDHDKSGNEYAAPYPVYHQLINTDGKFAVPVDSKGDSGFNAEFNLTEWTMNVKKNGSTVASCSGRVDTQNCNEGNWCNVPCDTDLTTAECEAAGWPEGCGQYDSEGNLAYWASAPWVKKCAGNTGGTCFSNDSSCCENAMGASQQFPGAQFCDTVWMMCDGQAEPGVQYDIQVDIRGVSQWTGSGSMSKTLTTKYVNEGDAQSYVGTYACSQPVDNDTQNICKSGEGQSNWEFVQHPLFHYNEYNFGYPSPSNNEKIVGAYWTEWAAYKRFEREVGSPRRRYYAQNSPFHQLTHVLYAFVPICGNGPTGQGQLALCTVNDCASKDPEDLQFGNPYFNLRARACKFNLDGTEASTAGATGFHQLESDFEVVLHDPWSAFHIGGGQLLAIESVKKQYPDLKLLPSVGGWTMSKMFYHLDDPAHRAKFVASCEKFLGTWKVFDGIDIDWEFPGGSGQDDGTVVTVDEWPMDNSSKVNMKKLESEGKLTTITRAIEVEGNSGMKDAATYTAIMHDLRAMLDRLGSELGRKFELSSAVSANASKIDKVDYASVANEMDHIFIMSYDLNGAWNKWVGHQTNLYPHPDKPDMDSTSGAAERIAAQGFPMEKLVMGAAMYGRGWKNVGAGTPESYLAADGSTVSGTNYLWAGNDSTEGCDGDVEKGVVDYSTIAAGVDSGACEYFFDDCAQAPLANCGGQIYTYDDARSVAAKGKYVMDNNMGGIFAWVLDQDNGDILNAMHESVGHTVKSGTPILHPGGYPARTCGDKPIVTTTRAPTTPAPVDMKCCVKVSAIDRASECNVSMESACNSSACAWSVATECVDAVHPDGSVIPTIAPPVVTPAPPVVTPAPPVVTPAPPVVTEAPPVVTPAPPVVTEAPPVVTPAPPVVTEGPPTSGGCHILNTNVITDVSACEQCLTGYQWWPCNDPSLCSAGCHN